MLIGMPKEMHEALAAEARRRNCSMSQIVKLGLDATLPSHDPAWKDRSESRLSLYLSEDTEARLREVAERTGTRITDLVRAAIAEELAKEEAA